MKRFSVLFIVVLLSVVVFTSYASLQAASTFESIPGFSDEANQQLAQVFDAIAEEKGKVVAAFDWGKTICHKREGSGYMSHETVIEHAKENPEKVEASNAVIKADEMDADDYFILRSSSYCKGVKADDIARVGYEVYKSQFEVYPAMRNLIQRLQAHKVKVLIVSNGDYHAMRNVVEEELGLDPENSLYAYRSEVDSSGVCTGVLMPPKGEGKSKDLVLSELGFNSLFLAGGDSALSSDGPMLDMAKFQLAVNPKSEEDAQQIRERWSDAIIVYPK